jgi:hypothetical protein
MSRTRFRFLICDMDEGTGSNIASMLPSIKSARAGAEPNPLRVLAQPRRPLHLGQLTSSGLMSRPHGP